MLKITTTEGIEYTGDDHKSIVRQMRNTQWNAPVIKRDYITEAADRVQMMTGQRPDTTDAKTFIVDLARIGLVTISTYDEPQRETEEA